MKIKAAEHKKEIYFIVIIGSHLKVKYQNQEPRKQASSYILHCFRNSVSRKNKFKKNK